MNIVIGLIIAALAASSGYLFGNTESGSKSVVSSDTRNDGQTVAASDYLSLRPYIAATASEDLSESERAGLLYMREEEKLARDVYLTLFEDTALPIFENIAQSEQTHTEAVRALLVKYDIVDPAEDAIGQFKDLTLAQLYMELIERGSKSESDALAVGAYIEDLDLYDLEVRLSETDNEDIRTVYENLARGSRNHLRAFVRNIERRGETYEPTHITKEQYAAIIGSPQEKGGAGRGWGNR